MLPTLPTQQQTATSKLKRDFQFESLEDPTRRQETFNNTGLNASTSDSQMFLGTFKNVRSSIITSSEERDKEKEKDASRRARNGRSPGGDSSSRNGNGNGNGKGNGAGRSSKKNKSKPDHDSIEDLNGPQEGAVDGTGVGVNPLNNIWHNPAKDREPDSEEVLSFFPGKSCSNSSSNTVNIGLNIDLDPTLDLEPHVNEVVVCIDKKNREMEDNIDNDDDGTYDGMVITGDTESSPRPRNFSPPSPPPASALSKNISHSSSGSMSDATPLASSSRLLSSNPSFPSRSLPSRFATSPSSPSFPSSSSRFPSSADKKAKVRPVCYFASPGLFQRILITALAHPFLVVSVKMITNPELNGQNWMYSYVHIVSRSGFGGLYSGIRCLHSTALYSVSWIILNRVEIFPPFDALSYPIPFYLLSWRCFLHLPTSSSLSFLLYCVYLRAAIGATLIPFPHSFLFGMTETVLYRCMLDQVSSGNVVSTVSETSAEIAV